MKVVILGAGATSGTLGKPAGAADFLACLRQGCPDWQTTFAVLQSIVEGVGARPDAPPSIEDIWARADYYAKFRAILGSEYGPGASNEIHKAVLLAYSFTQDVARIVQGDKAFTLAAVLDELGPGDALISFNWDTLAESLMMKLLGKDLVQAPHPDADSAVRLIKPHGSLAWVHTRDERDPRVCRVHRRNGRAPLIEVMHPDEVQVGRADAHFSEPFVIGAVPVKSELLEEVQRDHPESYQTVCEQWREALSALTNATKVTFMGYGFPASDDYGRFLIGEAVRRRPHTAVALPVRYYTRNRDAASIGKILREILASADVVYAGEVKAAAVFRESKAENRSELVQDQG